MAVLSLLIINKSGGLIYNATYPAAGSSGLGKLSGNDYLILAGTFHGVHAISSQISPLGVKGGLELLETDTFRLHCFQTLTGTKILVVTDVRAQREGVDAVFRNVYQLYADYVLKNPFYTWEMPIRCARFDKALDAYCTRIS
ncbi:Trafficking protein particle complex subunit 4 [Savitreella phatthalungensis]